MDQPLPLFVAVDDESDDIFFLRHLLQKAGVPHRFQPFSNAEAAMVALTSMAVSTSQADYPAICFLDIKMIGQSGFELLKWIREQRGLDVMPVVMFSSSDHPEDVAKARELGAQGYLAKYPSTEAMRTVLDQAMACAATPDPTQKFLRWSYRFIDTPSPFAVK